MVGIAQIPAIEEAVAEENLKSQSVLHSTKALKVSLDPYLTGLEDFSLSFPDFDSISGFFAEGNTERSRDLIMADLGVNPVVSDSVKSELGASKESFEVIGDGFLEKDEVQKELRGKEGSSLDSGLEEGESGVVERSSEMGSDGICKKIYKEGVLDGDGASRKLEDFGSLIEEQLGKVNLDGALHSLGPVIALENDKNAHGDLIVVNGGIGSMSYETVILDSSSMKIDSKNDERDVVGVKESGTKIDGTVCNEDKRDSESESDGESDESDEESESESASSSSSSSSSTYSSSDEEEDEDNGDLSGEKNAKNDKCIVDEQIDIEEGEIMSCDPEEMVSWSDVEGDGSGAEEPIKSKNELKVLPPVPPVSVTLQPHHETLPVGTVFTIVDEKVIVEGDEKHKPLNEGSILWITESRLPLGIIDEIFGPVKKPYYIVRYNSEGEVPTGIQQGTPISFVQEFANHILNDKNLYQKGYDASGEHDEELFDEVEFSDDEKEAEYKRSLKTKKRGKNKSKPGAERNEKGKPNDRARNWNHNRSQTPVTEDQHMVPPVATSLNQVNYSCSPGFRQDLAGDQALTSPYPDMAQAPVFCPSDGIRFPPQQQQSVGLPPGFPANGMLWMQQNQPYPLFQTPFQTGVGLQQHMTPITGGLPLNINQLAGQLNSGLGPALGFWTTSQNQNMLNPLQFGMGLQAQQAPPSQGSQVNHNLQPSPASLGETVTFNQGHGGGGRRGGPHRGRGRYAGRRGR